MLESEINDYIERIHQLPKYYLHFLIIIPKNIFPQKHLWLAFLRVSLTIVSGHISAPPHSA